MKCQGIPTDMFSTEGHPIFLLWLWRSTGTSFSILRRYITTLLEGCILVFKDMLNAKLLPLQTRLRAWTMSECTRQRFLRPGHWSDPPPIGWQDVNPNPVHNQNSCSIKGSDNARPTRRPRCLPARRLCPGLPQSTRLGPASEVHASAILSYSGHQRSWLLEACRKKTDSDTALRRNSSSELTKKAK